MQVLLLCEVRSFHKLRLFAFITAGKKITYRICPVSSWIFMNTSLFIALKGYCIIFISDACKGVDINDKMVS